MHATKSGCGTTSHGSEASRLKFEASDRPGSNLSFAPLGPVASGHFHFYVENTVHIRTDYSAMGNTGPAEYSPRSQASLGIVSHAQTLCADGSPTSCMLGKRRDRKTRSEAGNLEMKASVTAC